MLNPYYWQEVPPWGGGQDQILILSKRLTICSIVHCTWNEQLINCLVVPFLTSTSVSVTKSLRILSALWSRDAAYRVFIQDKETNRQDGAFFNVCRFSCSIVLFSIEWGSSSTSRACPLPCAREASSRYSRALSLKFRIVNTVSQWESVSAFVNVGMEMK